MISIFEKEKKTNKKTKKIYNGLYIVCIYFVRFLYTLTHYAENGTSKIFTSML